MRPEPPEGAPGPTPQPPRDQAPSPQTHWLSGMSAAGPYLGLGLQLGFSIALFTGAGYGLDRLLGTLPWLTVAGGLLGMVAMFAQVIRVSNEMGRASAARKRSREAPPPRRPNEE